MSRENSIVRFNGKNYASWEFQFRMFVKGKELWGHLDRSSKAPTDPKELSLWESKDAKIASWLLSSIEPHLVNNLRGFTPSQVPKAAFTALQMVHSKSQRDQFLMKLRPEFESARAGLINCTPVPSLEVCLEDDPDLHHNVIVAKKLGTLPNIAARNSAIISTFVPISSSLPAVPISSSNITPKQVQQMIISALSALGLQGQTHLLTSPWLIDSAASNHTTGSLTALEDVRSSVRTGDSEGA
ncbi:hypothetical protein Patl1_03682 [Pistacia atlantica]|uniref:Uncharacterized protein n=1 Tax=Pistacia atlantica TaxID=434234 RepID=A0ACC1BWC3_9ROSI|nr:hypothetical protein Patl1_03682 [Pistacia atlantica]